MAAITYGEMTAGIRPNFASDNENVATCVPTAISQHATNPTPPPSAAPCTRAMVGFERPCNVDISVASALASRRFSSGEYSAMRFIQLRSAPAEKDLPAADKMTTRTSGFASNN